MPQIKIDEVNGKVVVTVDDDLTPIVLNEFEVLQYRKFADDSIRFCNKERFADLPVEAVGLSDIVINGVVPGSFAALDAALLTLFPEMPSSGSGGGVEILSASRTLTDEQIKALPTTGVEIVAAPGEGKMISIIDVLVISNITAIYTDITDASLQLLSNGAAVSTVLRSESLYNSTGQYFAKIPPPLYVCTNFGFFC